MPKKPKSSPRPRLNKCIIPEAKALARRYTFEKGVPVDWQAAILLAIRAEAMKGNVPRGDAR